MMRQKPNTSADAIEAVWRSPTVAEIAREARLGTATVDRVLNARGNVSEATRAQVLSAMERLRPERAALAASTGRRRIAFLCDSGISFSNTLEAAVADYCTNKAGLECPFFAVTTAKTDPIKFANMIERSAGEADALVIVAREDLIINRAIRNVVARKTPVVCLTTDLPASGRDAYIGSDPTASGSTAAYLMGQMVGKVNGKILLVYSAPYRVQEEREMGFRRVLRSEFSGLAVEERVNSNDDADFVYQNVVRYIQDHGAPAGIYNVAGGNIGIGKAINEFGLAGKLVFIGHELNFNSRHLLETGVMNCVIGHDVPQEVDAAIAYALSILDHARPAPPIPTPVQIFTKYSCN